MHIQNSRIKRVYNIKYDSLVDPVYIIKITFTTCKNKADSVPNRSKNKSRS